MGGSDNGTEEVGSSSHSDGAPQSSSPPSIGAVGGGAPAAVAAAKGACKHTLRVGGTSGPTRGAFSGVVPTPPAEVKAPRVRCFTGCLERYRLVHGEHPKFCHQQMPSAIRTQ